MLKRERKMESKSHATFRQLCQLEICHQLSLRYVRRKQRSLLNRNSLNFTMFTSGLRKWPWKRYIKYFSFYEYPPALFRNQLLASYQVYDISNLKCYGNWKNKVEMVVLAGFSFVSKSEQYHTKKKSTSKRSVRITTQLCIHLINVHAFLFWRIMSPFHGKVKDTP